MLSSHSIHIAPISTDDSLVSPAQQPKAPSKSPITTHVLDTCLGRPAADVGIVLQRLVSGSNDVWESVAVKRTNADGRVPDLLPSASRAEPGMYKITFDTEEYMRRCRQLHPTFFIGLPFYPKVSVHFRILPDQVDQHFHVPLTWNPFGYSTYRGS
jgi:hydroxyisourate hydrolase